jgi:tripartite-type tricarboxylate transporter receptor subunit TctC
VAAARGNNGVGVTGAAPRAGLSGIRLTAAATTDLQESQALTFQNDNAPSSGGTLAVTTTDRTGSAGYNTAASASGGDYTPRSTARPPPPRWWPG